MNPDQLEAYQKLVQIACVHGGDKARWVIQEFVRGMTIKGADQLIGDLMEELQFRQYSRLEQRIKSE